MVAVRLRREFGDGRQSALLTALAPLGKIEADVRSHG
jgi:hypothetical protein